MPASLSPIPVGVAITDRAGAINEFFRLRWQELIDAFTKVPTVATVARTNQGAAIVTTAAYTIKDDGAGVYRISYVLHKTVADGVNSSLTITLSWLRGGIALSQPFAALVLDTTAAQQNGSILVKADANSDLSYAVAYASNTPGQMKFEVDITVEKMAA